MKLLYDTSWDHHYAGWGYCLDALRDLGLQTQLAVVGSIEQYLKQKNSIREPWIGFLHVTPNNPTYTSILYGSRNDISAESILSSPDWDDRMSFCEGIIVFTQYLKDFVSDRCKFPVHVIRHPTKLTNVRFSCDEFLSQKKPHLLLIGHWLRNFQMMYDVDAPDYTKTILKSKGQSNYALLKTVIKTNDSVKMLDWLPNDKYDKLISKSLVFCPLHDASACNALIEMIVRDVPILVSRLPGVEEYVGENYPLLFSTQQEAELLMQDKDLIISGHVYLKDVNKERFGIDSFLSDFSGVVSRTKPTPLFL